MNKFIEYHISYEELAVNPNAAATMLGYDTDLPDDVLEMVQEVMDETTGCYDIRGGYVILDNPHFDKDGYKLTVGETVFQIGKIIYQQLKHSSQIAAFVCTAGVGIEQYSRAMLTNNEPLKGFVADILGGVVVEAAINKIQQELSNDMKTKGLNITNRYSPGYCGWQTAEQHKLFAQLPTTLGVQLTESALMQPVKSVSGIIGIGAGVKFNPYTCRLCEATQCIYRFKQ
ncbi:methionine synthase [Bacteroidia bacterium]|nr:methionine synthase [Bacteroidia bacterium]